MKRRNILSLAGFLALPPALLASERDATPSQTEGPFYPVEPIPIRASLIANETTLQGKTMVLDGQVVDRKGAPLVGTKIEIWQCDGTGIYDHPAQNGRERFDRSFQGFGAQMTGEQGSFRFITLFPVPYTGRPPHIHVKLWNDDDELLTTQLYLKGDIGKGLFRSRRDQLQIDPAASEGDQLNASFTFVV